MSLTRKKFRLVVVGRLIMMMLSLTRKKVRLVVKGRLISLMFSHQLVFLFAVVVQVRGRLIIVTLSHHMAPPRSALF